MQVTNNGTTALQSKGVNLKLFKWNIDILAPSFFHATYAAGTTAFTGEKWCSEISNGLATDGKTTTL